MSDIYQKYILCKIGFYFTFCISIIGVFYLENEWCAYLVNAGSYELVEADIIKIKKEFSPGGRSSECYTYMVYKKDNKQYEVKMLTCCTDYYHDTKPVTIAVKNGKSARVKPIIPNLDFSNDLILLSLLGSIILFILGKGYKKKVENNLFREDNILKKDVTFVSPGQRIKTAKGKYKWMLLVMLLDWMIMQSLEPDSIIRLLLFLFFYSCIIFGVIKVFLLISDYIRSKK